MLNEEMTKVNNNICTKDLDSIMDKNNVDLNEFALEDERLNLESWKYFDELASVVSKIDEFSKIMDKIQAALVLPPLMPTDTKSSEW